MARQVFEALILLALVCAPPPLASAADQEDPKQTGPVALIIQYECLPRDRAEFRHRLGTEDMQSFARSESRWPPGRLPYPLQPLRGHKQRGMRWPSSLSAGIRMSRAGAEWRRNRRRGSARGLPGADDHRRNLSRRSDAAGRIRTESPAHAVYLVVPYTYSVSTPAYLKYFDDYVGLQFKGWMAEDVLAGYQLYLQRYTAARPWDSLIFLKYKDDESFGQRERIVAKIRAQLQDNPTWKAASDNKQNLRVEKEAVIADELSPNR